MFGDMAWADGQDDLGGTPSEWEIEMMRMRFGEGGAAAAPVSEPMELSPDPFYLSNTPTTSAASLNTAAVNSSITTTAPTFGGVLAPPTLTSSASCPSFTSLYDFDSDDLLRDIPDGEPLVGGAAFPAGPMGIGGPPMNIGAGYDYVLQFQQQHQHGNMRQFPHQNALMSNDHMAVLQQPRRPIQTSASFTSLSSMETEYRRRLAAKRKKAVAERWNKAQRHKSFDSTTSSVATAPSPSTSMEFSTYTNTTTSTFEPAPETQYLEDLPAPRRSIESEMIGFSIDEFPTTLTSDATWPMPPPMSLNSFDAFAQAPPASDTTPSDMDQLLLSDQEKANVSSLLDAIRDFDSPLPTHTEGKPTQSAARRASPKLSSRPRSTSGQNQHRAGRSPHLRGIARTDSAKRKESTSSPIVAPIGAPTIRHEIGQSLHDSVASSIRERIQQVLDNPSASVILSEEEQTYMAQAPQFSAEKASEMAGSLWLLIHSSKCADSACSIGGCDVMRRVIRHCRGCEAPLGKCRDPCNDAKAMLLHHATCSIAKQTPEKEDEKRCTLCVKMQEIDKAHNALKSRPPLSPQPKPHPSPQPMPMIVPPLGISALNALGGPVLIAPQPAFVAPTLKPVGSGSKHVPIQPNPLPTASNPMGMIGAFPRFGVSLALYLEQTSAAFRAEVKSRVEKRVTNAAGQDLILHMQKKTRLRSLEDLRAEARANVLGEMERELQLHMQAVNWASVANSSSGEPPSQSTASTLAEASETGLPSYLLSVAAAGFAAFYAQQASLQAAIAGAGSPFGVSAPSRRPLSRQSSAGSLTTSASSSSLSSVPLAPKRSASSSSLTHQSPAMSPKESLPSADKNKEAPLTV